MRRTIALIAVGALLLGAFAAPATGAKKKKKKKPAARTVEATYDSPAIGMGGVGGVCLGSNGCVMFATSSNESFMALKGDDQSGQKVFLRVVQDTDGDGTNEGVASICGETSEPIPITPGVQVSIFIYAVGANPPCPGPATSGKVTATFTSAP